LDPEVVFHTNDVVLNSSVPTQTLNTHCKISVHTELSHSLNNTVSQSITRKLHCIFSDNEIQKYFLPEGLFVQLSTCLQSLDRESSDNTKTGSSSTELKETSKPLFSRFKIKKDKSRTSTGRIEDFKQVFIVKWVDYSNKYGFGAQLSDGSVSVRFNDCTKISLSLDRR
jgi:hypothetical protein